MFGEFTRESAHQIRILKIYPSANAVLLSNYQRNVADDVTYNLSLSRKKMLML